MSAVDLIRVVEDHGGRVFMLDGAMKLTAPKPLPGDLIERLRGAKPEIITLLERRKNEICGQCAVIVTEGQEYLNVVADGFPGIIHLDCYDRWYDAHLKGRYS